MSKFEFIAHNHATVLSISSILVFAILIHHSQPFKPSPIPRNKRKRGRKEEASAGHPGVQWRGYEQGWCCSVKQVQTMPSSANEEEYVMHVVGKYVR
jgi:hypothetical protein